MVTTFADKIEQTLLEDMKSFAEIIDRLRAEGYEHNFELFGRKLKCVETYRYYHQLCFHVDEIFRMEDGLGHQQRFSIFALRHRDENSKGIFIAIGV
jgi:hypothetical protein